MHSCHKNCPFISIRGENSTTQCWENTPSVSLNQSSDIDCYMWCRDFRMPLQLSSHIRCANTIVLSEWHYTRIWPTVWSPDRRRLHDGLTTPNIIFQHHLVIRSPWVLTELSLILTSTQPRSQWKAKRQHRLTVLVSDTVSVLRPRIVNPYSPVKRCGAFHLSNK